VERIHAALMPILASPALHARMTPDMIPAPMPAAAFGHMLAEEGARLGALIRERGLTTG
jgi:hypothetical protein